MPTYQYRCTECSEEFEEFQKITDPPIKSCPKCGGKVKRIVSGGAGFLLKGSGFYTTDYRGDSYQKAADKEKAETKPAAKTDTKMDKATESKKSKTGD